MKKNTIFAAILAGTLAVSLQLCSNEIAAGAANPAPSMNAPATMPSDAAAMPAMSAEAANAMTSRLISSFRDSLKANHAAGALVINSTAGNTLASYSDMDKDFGSNSLAAAALDKRMDAATKKAFTTSYMGTDTATISDRDLAQHNASLASGNLTNLAGGVVIKDAAGKPCAVIGVSAVGANGQDLSAKIAAEMGRVNAGAASVKWH